MIEGAANSRPRSAGCETLARAIGAMLVWALYGSIACAQQPPPRTLTIGYVEIEDDLGPDPNQALEDGSSSRAVGTLPRFWGVNPD